jgi:predicted metal-dependent hydrolase
MDTVASLQINSPHPGAHVGRGTADACSEPPPGLLLKGIEEFNDGHYWECHETLEQLWRAEPRPVRDLYQGILQIGVGIYHLERGNYAGAVKVLGRGLTRLEGLPEVCQGVRVLALATAARRVYEELVTLGPVRIEMYAMSDLSICAMQS